MDSDLRSVLVKVQDCLSNDDRQRLHFFLGSNVPRRIRDDTSLSGTLSLIESLFEQDKINEQDCTFLINAFETIQCHDAVRLLKDYQIRTQLISIEEDKYARENYSTVIGIDNNKSKDNGFLSDKNIINFNPVNVIVNSEKLSDDMKRNDRLLRIGKFILFIFMFVLITGLIISTSINTRTIGKLKNDLQTKDRTLVDEQMTNKKHSETNSRLFRELTQLKQAMSLSNVTSVSIRAKSLANGIVVFGGNGKGDALNQLVQPMYMTMDDDDQTIYISDQYNQRVLAWKINATQGKIVAGGNGRGVNLNQFQFTFGVAIDKKNDSLIIADYRNRRVVRWPRRNGTAGETIISDIECWGLAMDSSGYIYTADPSRHEVRRWAIGETDGTLIAGGYGPGFGLDQLNHPRGVYIDRNDTIYIADPGNHRILKLTKGAKLPTIAAGGRGPGNSLLQLNNPVGSYVDNSGALYIVDNVNDRVMRWRPGAIQGEVFIGGNGRGNKPNQLNNPADITADQYGNFYVLEFDNGRIKMFPSSELN